MCLDSGCQIPRDWLYYQRLQSDGLLKIQPMRCNANAFLLMAPYYAVEGPSIPPSVGPIVCLGETREAEDRLSSTWMTPIAIGQRTESLHSIWQVAPTWRVTERNHSTRLPVDDGLVSSCHSLALTFSYVSPFLPAVPPCARAA